MPKGKIKNKLFSFTITEKNKEIIEKFANKNNISMSQALNSLIDNSSQNLNKNIEVITKNDEKISVRILFSAEDYNIIKDLASKEFLSIRRYIKFLVSKHIYKNQSLSNSTINHLKEIKKELSYIGANMNTLAKNSYLNEKIDENFKLELEILVNFLKKEKENLQQKIQKFSEINSSRF